MVAPPTTYDVEKLRREQFPVSQNVTYLNHAGISPIPTVTADKVREIIDDLAYNPTEFFATKAAYLFDNFGPQVASYIHAADPLEITMTKSTSLAMNLVAHAIDWQAGDNLILCNYEFPSNAYPWMSVKRYGVDVRLVEPQFGTLTVEKIDEAADENTRLVAISAIQFFTGAKADLQAIGDYCHDHNILLAVDAIQAIGHMAIDVQKMHIDILASGAQKSMMALPGSGFLYVRRDVVETLHPISIGPNATDGWEHWTAYDMSPREGALRFMTGTMSLEGAFSVLSSLHFLSDLGLANIDDYTTALAQSFMEDLTEADHTVLTPTEPHQHGPIVTFKISDNSEFTAQVFDDLKAENVMLAKHLDKNGLAYLRIAVHCYNNEEDKEQFLRRLSEIIRRYS